MKCVSLCLVLFCAAAVYGYPQRVTLVGLPESFGQFYNPYSSAHEDIGATDDGVVDIMPSDHAPDSTEMDTATFGEVMRAMQEAMIRLRQEMNAILRRLPTDSDDKGLEDSFPFGSDFDLSDAKNKSTSETKVVDGQLVTVNETVVTSGGDGAAAVYRIKTVQVRPTEHPLTDSDVEGETTAASEGHHEAEPVSSNNEDSNDIPNRESKVGSEVDDLNKA